MKERGLKCIIYTRRKKIPNLVTAVLEEEKTETEWAVKSRCPDKNLRANDEANDRRSLSQLVKQDMSM